MLYLGQPYYVGLLSAAAIHGAAHQQPMVFQVMTNKPTREVRAGKVTIQFTMNCKIEQLPVMEKQTETGSMRVSTPETTAFDLVHYPAGAGHLSNVATVLAELAESMSPHALASTARLVRLPDVQRLGYLLDAIGESKLVEPLYYWLETQKPRTIPLRPGKPTNVNINQRWHIMPNEELEFDL